MKGMNAISKTDIFSHWVNISYLPRWGVLLLDLLIVLVSFTISKVIGTNLLKYAVVYGANASGKSNLVDFFIDSETGKIESLSMSMLANIIYTKYGLKWEKESKNKNAN